MIFFLLFYFVYSGIYISRSIFYFKQNRRTLNKPVSKIQEIHITINKLYGVQYTVVRHKQTVSDQHKTFLCVRENKIQLRYFLILDIMSTLCEKTNTKMGHTHKWI